MPTIVHADRNVPIYQIESTIPQIKSAEDNPTVRLRINILISALALATIVWSVRFAVAQEHRRTSQYLQSLYQELNERFFENTLPPARFEWTDLSGEDAMGLTFRENDGFVIQVDRKTNFSLWVDDELRDTVEHEACHAVTWGAEQDAHGPRWQACMARVKAQADHKHN